jgi:hypothetical protein
MTAPLLGHYGVQLWMPEAGGRVDFASEHDEQAMTILGLSSKREVTRTSIRVRTAMAVQVRDQGRYLGGRPPYGYRLGDAGPHPNKAHAAWGRRAHRLEPAAPVDRAHSPVDLRAADSGPLGCADALIDGFDDRDAFQPVVDGGDVEWLGTEKFVEVA